ncbi:MAG: integration host factor subunit beta [Deferribacteres bacterium]|nr:integration host factor subunit beta [candidate division KSB1 bacterium]MCB9501499.1 integration host factor subunit beta [Deferribacteres bacterium]
MTKSEIINIVAEGTGLTKVETAAVVDGFLATISYSLATGNNVTLRGFGSFRVVERSGRQGINPKTGQDMNVPPHKAPVFKASKELRRSVESGLEVVNFE